MNDWKLMHIRVTPELYEAIKAEADAEDRDVAWMIRRALTERFLKGRMK